MFGRLVLTLSAVALLSTALALAAQDLVLARDLERAANERLGISARAATRLVEVHLEAVGERYRAVSGTPQFRANLELEHAPTLRFYAEQLQAQQGAALLAFLDQQGRLRAAAGDERLVPDAEAAGASLVSRGEHAYAQVAVPLGSAESPVGWLVAVEPVSDAHLANWSELCGAALSIARPLRSAPGDTHAPLARSVWDLGGLELRAEADLGAERRALQHSRLNLLLAGAVALCFSLLASVLLSRGVVRPIREIHDAAERIGRGDLEGRLDSPRRDEFGEVARTFDWMLSRLGEQRDELASRLRELHRSQGRLANAQRIARIGSFDFDLERNQLNASDVLRDLFRLPPEPAPIDVELLLSRIPPEERGDLEAGVQRMLAEGAPLHADHRLLLASGDERIMSSQVHLVRDDLGQLVGLEGTCQDVTERNRAQEQIRFLAYHDALTGLGNRRLFGERLQLAISQARRQSRALGVLFVDLDHFKRINDTLGHAVGDQLLQEVAGRLTRGVRDTDTIARSDAAEFEAAVSRLGGDEFTILVTDVADPQSLSKVARRLLDVMAHPFELKGHEVVVNASIGIAAWPVDGEDADALLRNADSAMYHAKKQGRNNYQFYTARMNAAALKRLSLEAKLRRALGSDDFQIHFQPRVRLSDGRVSSFEALARWQDPELGRVSPGEFIPVAEESGLIVELGQRVLRDACRQVVRWSGDPRGALPVSVNLSVHQFRSGNLISDVQGILEETGVDPGQIELEITESTLAHDERAVLADLERLRALGLHLALDDFGTGFSSLSMLRRMPVDILKVDMSFVRDIVDDPDDAALTQAIVSMGQALGLRVVAEGVETPEQLALLRSWRCDEIQGYLVSPAVPESETERFRAGAALV